MPVIPSPSADGIDTVGAGAPADEIEIMPAMINDGVIELRNFRYDFDDERDAVIRIWQAMWDARPNSLHRSD
jgi:hypothetical protein